MHSHSSSFTGCDSRRAQATRERSRRGPLAELCREPESRRLRRVGLARGLRAFLGDGPSWQRQTPRPVSPFSALPAPQGAEVTRTDCPKRWPSKRTTRSGRSPPAPAARRRRAPRPRLGLARPSASRPQASAVRGHRRSQVIDLASMPRSSRQSWQRTEPRRASASR
jgi:hypothetical protein